jgi:hypothetical protein
VGLRNYYKGKIEELELIIKDKSHNLRRLEAQRNELNTSGRMGVVLPTNAGPGSVSDVHGCVRQCVCYGRSYSCCRSLAHTWERSSRQVLLPQNMCMGLQLLQ